MIQVAVLGYGYWGPNLARNIEENSGCRLTAIADPQLDHLANAQQRYPGIRLFQQSTDLLASENIDAVIVSTPAGSHFELALAALRQGKHVLVEKPLAGSCEQAECLVSEAERRGLVLMVDHTFVYTGAVRKIRQLVKEADFGELCYYDSIRVNRGILQRDLNVLWDLAVHDLSIIDTLLDEPVRAVSATGFAHLTSLENIAYLSLFFDTPLIAHVSVNWLGPTKVRQTLIGGSRKTLLYDDLEPIHKLKLYETGVNRSSVVATEDRRPYSGADTRDELWAPELDASEALGHVVRAFIRSIATGVRPLTDGPAGLRVIRVLEAATRSIRLGGSPVEIKNAVLV